MAKAAAKKTTAAKSPKPMTKSEMLTAISESTELSKKEVQAVFDALNDLIVKDMSAKGRGVFTIPGLVKITRKHVPAKAARKNAPDPFNPGQTRDYPAKPASTKPRVVALKNLKDATT